MLPLLYKILQQFRWRISHGLQVLFYFSQPKVVKDSVSSNHTVDGKNPAITSWGWSFISLFTRLCTSQVVQDFFHSMKKVSGNFVHPFSSLFHIKFTASEQSPAWTWQRGGEKTPAKMTQNIEIILHHLCPYDVWKKQRYFSIKIWMERIEYRI